MTTVLKPGILVSLKTTLQGGVHYAVKDLESDGKRRAKWETTRTIDDPDEHERAVKVRAAASNLIRAVCAHTAFGLLCPTDRETELQAAVEQARSIVSAHNETASVTQIHVYVLTGRIASSDTEAIQAIASEISDLLAQMDQGIHAANPAQIRDAAKRAKDLGAILDGKQAELVADAVKAAREAARAIVKRVEKDGEAAETVLAELTLTPIETARFAFLDLEETAPPTEPRPLLPAVALQRFAFDDDEPAVPTDRNPAAEYDETTGKEKTIAGGMFIALNSDGEESFRQWARDNYAPGKPADPCWHPVVQDEWSKLSVEHEFFATPETAEAS